MNELIEMARRQSRHIECRYKVMVLAFDRRGRFLGIARNSPRFKHLGGGVHAEVAALHKFGPSVKTMILLRFGNSGELRPIHCCPNCDRIMKKVGIKIIRVHG